MEKELNNKTWKVLSTEDHKKLDKAQEKFLNDNSGFFAFLQKYDPKDFQDCINKYCAQSYLEFIKELDVKLYERLWNSEEAIVENLKRKNPFDGMSPENIQTIEKALGRSIEFYGKNGRLTKDKISLYAKVFETYDSEKQIVKKTEWSNTFRKVSKSKDENDNPLISDEKDRKRQMKQFLNFRNENNLNSLSDFKKYLRLKDYPNNFFQF